MAITATAKLQLPVGQIPEGSTNDTLSDFSAEKSDNVSFVDPAGSWPTGSCNLAVAVIAIVYEFDGE